MHSYHSRRSTQPTAPPDHDCAGTAQVKARDRERAGGKPQHCNKLDDVQLLTRQGAVTVAVDSPSRVHHGYVFSAVHTRHSAKLMFSYHLNWSCCQQEQHRTASSALKGSKQRPHHPRTLCHAAWQWGQQSTKYSTVTTGTRKQRPIPLI